jgi:hypothetical protein
MNILVLILLIIGAITVIALAPFALLMSGFSFDAGASPAAYAMAALFFAVPISAGWCVWQGWQYWQQGAFDTALKYALYPALLAVACAGFFWWMDINDAAQTQRLAEEMRQREEQHRKNDSTQQSPSNEPQQPRPESGTESRTK